MPKTIAITPSWYWPASTTRVCGVPPFRLDEHLFRRWARRSPDGVALVDGTSRFTWSELAQAVDAAAAGLAARVPAGGRVAFVSGPTAEGLVLLLGLVRAGIPLVALPPASAHAVGAVSAWVGDDAAERAASMSGAAAIRLAGVSAVVPPGTALATPGIGSPMIGFPTADSLAWHSSRSMLGAAVSLQSYYSVDGGRPWLSTLDLSDWQGMVACMVPLAAGTTTVLAPPGEGALEAIAREAIGTSVWLLERAFEATKESKRQVKSIRGVQERVILFTGRLFDPDQRRRVGKLFDSPALTVFGLPETGPIFASHPSWYLDESVGIPISNAWVVPVDPRTANPIPTLWELVESAMVTVWSPSLTVGYEGGEHQDRFRDGRFITGVIASSDANGMVYLLPD